MLTILSPSKKLTQDVTTNANLSLPQFLDDACALIDVLKKKSSEEVSALMGLSHQLTELNVARYKAFNTPFTKDNAAPALLSFQGDVYDGLDASSLSDEDIEFANSHIRLLSGLYGILRPLDLMQAYRLEMGTKLATGRGKHLYDFWGNRITDEVNRLLEQQNHPCLLNLASNEYSKVIDMKKVKAPVITVQFKERRDDKYRMLMIYVKRARGMMARYVIQNRIENVNDIRAFNEDNYAFNDHLSDDTTWVFTR